MQNFSDDVHTQSADDFALQTFFKTGISPDDISAVYSLKRAQPVLQAFTAIFHGGFNGVLLRLLATMASGVLAWWLTDYSLSRLDIAWFDVALQHTMVSVLSRHHRPAFSSNP